MAALGDLDLKASEERLQLALRGAELAMWDWNIQTGEVHFDERWKAMLGYGPDELPSALEVWVERLHPDDAVRAQAIVQDHLAGRTPDFTQEFRLRHRDGSWVWVLARGKVLEREADGLPVRACGTHLDITAQKDAEAERRRLEAQIQHAQKLESLGVLAGGIAHDFNNLLVSILGNADLALAELPTTSPIWTNLDEIRTAATRASELTNQMLAYSGKGRFVVESIDLDELVREIGQLLEVSTPKSVTLAHALAGDLPAIEVDATQIRQVVMNLVTNAADATAAGGGTISLATGTVDAAAGDLTDMYSGEDLAPGRYVFLEVADTGCGMAAETRARLFDPFYTTKSAGRGLGLAAVLGIVHGHRGTIHIDSEPGRGTRVQVLLPEGTSGLPRRAESSRADDGSGLPAGTVLVVDDEESVRRLAGRMIERAGASVLMASDGIEALEIYKQHGPAIDLVLLDLTMPRLDGVETLHELQRLDPDVRVVLTSGYSEVEATDRFASTGMAGFVQKPYTIEGLLRVMRRIWT